DPTTPEMTMLLVMLHTGTMFAVIVYFWRPWTHAYLSSWEKSWPWIKLLALATVLTGVVGIIIKTVIERYVFHNAPKADIELLFGNIVLIAVALAAAGVMIIWSGLRYDEAKDRGQTMVSRRQAIWMGIIQGLCLPFRGFSRSGATISVGLLTGASKRPVEEFSFALAVILTPPVVARETMRLIVSHQTLVTGTPSMMKLFLPSLLGLVFSFLAGLFALRWLTGWLDRGKWHYFGIYCMCASVIILVFYFMGR
ncbi:MAG TPA: undecaprenyl-diphosphate phosphatase, partial [Syntrophorhabdaceae bacterium]|nr:undecaprenyl-diphosphate phosphatase [Syntrophorhabdaceae bacterium]